MNNLKFRVNQTKKQKVNLIPSKVLNFVIVKQLDNSNGINFLCEYNNEFYKLSQTPSYTVNGWVANNDFVFTKWDIKNNCTIYNKNVFGRVMNFYNNK